jgi:hypothetical protein
LRIETPGSGIEPSNVVRLSILAEKTANAQGAMQAERAFWHSGAGGNEKAPRQRGFLLI